MNSGAPLSKDIPSLMDISVSRPKNLAGWTFPSNSIPAVNFQGQTSDTTGSRSAPPISFGNSVRLTIIEEVPVDLTTNSRIAHPETGNRAGPTANVPSNSGETSARLTEEEQKEAFAEMLRCANRCLDCIKHSREKEQWQIEKHELIEGTRIGTLEDEMLEARTHVATVNKLFNEATLEGSSLRYQLNDAKKEISELKKQLAAKNGSSTTEILDTGSMEKIQKRTNDQASSSDPSDVDPSDGSSSISSEDWDFSNDPTLQKRRKLNDNGPNQNQN